MQPAAAAAAAAAAVATANARRLPPPTLAGSLSSTGESTSATMVSRSHIAANVRLLGCFDFSTLLVEVLIFFCCGWYFFSLSGCCRCCGNRTDLCAHHCCRAVASCRTEPNHSRTRLQSVVQFVPDSAVGVDVDRRIHGGWRCFCRVCCLSAAGTAGTTCAACQPAGGEQVKRLNVGRIAVCRVQSAPLCFFTPPVSLLCALCHTYLFFHTIILFCRSNFNSVVQ